MFSIIDECTKTVLQNLLTASQQGNQINAKRIFGAFTMDVIASSAFSTKIDSHKNPDNPFVTAAKTTFQKRSQWRYLAHLWLPGLMEFLGVSIRSSDIYFFKDTTLQIIEERKRSGQTRNDFLQLLIDTTKELKEEEISKNLQDKENEDLSNYVEEVEEKTTPTSFKSLTVNEVVGQCIIFFLAGYETTANTLSNTAYCLALNEEVQEKLHQEIDRVLTQHKGELTYEAIQEMKYLDNVISEVLRLFPPIARVERVATQDYESPDLQFKIPKGTVIGVPVYAIHRDPRHFPDPEKFDPNRFSPEEKAKRDQYAYMPFFAGPRNCVAMRFALLELKICLVRVTSAFKFKRCHQTKVPLDFVASRGLTQPKEIIVGLEPRKKESNQERL